MNSANRPKLAVICDLAEENWPSMDLVADKLLSNLHERHFADVEAVKIQAPFRTRLGRLPLGPRQRLAFNADRLLNRLIDYPRYVSRQSGAYDWFHVCDHSYANVVHRLPGERTGVFCHDLDTFRSVLEPERERRPRWFREMARHILEGMQKASVVFHTTSTVRAEIERHGLIDPARLVQAPYGISHEFNTSRAKPDPATAPRLKRLGEAPYLLHVGSCIPRKRIDVLLDVFAALRPSLPELRLLQVGGEWTLEQRAQLARHDLEQFVWQFPRMSQAEIANLYRDAALVLMPSEAEGFGLPVIEALACGSIVVASDIPVFREVGGPAVVYCNTGAIADWARAVTGILGGTIGVPSTRTRLEWASRFSWAEHARRILAAYGS